MSALILDRQKPKTGSVITSQYDIVADAKNRISLRSATAKYFHVKAFANGCYVLEPRVLVRPASISTRSLKMIDRSVALLKQGKASPPIDLSAFA